MPSAQEARLTIIDEGDDYLVVDKPGDLVCHPTTGDEYSSLISRLRIYFRDQLDVTPHFVNRLDRETSGLVLISKRAEGHKLFCHAYNDATKTYQAIVWGWPQQDEGQIDGPLGPAQNSLVRLKQAVVEHGKEARTDWKLLQRFERNPHGSWGSPQTPRERYALLEVKPQTGRMHQIRVHLAHIGHPIVGDKIYGPDETCFIEHLDHGWTPRLEQLLESPRHLLSALELELETFRWKTELPQDMRLFSRME